MDASRRNEELASTFAMASGEIADVNEKRDSFNTACETHEVPD